MDKKWLKGLVGGVALALAASVVGANAQTQLSVYTAYESDDLAPYKQAFEAKHPDIKINWIRDSTGVVAAKLLAEKENPRADVVWGLAVTNVDYLKSQGVLENYMPENAKKIDPKFKDPVEPAAWFGNSGWTSAMIYNTVEGKKKGIPQPTTWQDLADPKYKGQIVMPHPASSGTGFMFVSAWIQSWGEEKAWAFMDKLHDNISRYTHSGSAPAVLAGRGEAVVGMAFELRGSRLQEEGAPIEIVMPKEALGWELNVFSVIKGSKNQQAAKVLAEWAASEDAMKIYGKTRSMVAMPQFAAKLPGVPADLTERVMKQDFAWAAQNRERILKEWEKRYGGKAEPKK